MRVVGVDGYQSGWVAVALDHGSFADAATFASFAELLVRFADARTIAVDIPIGLPPPWPRRADVEAAQFVGKRRGSVFPTFPAPVYEASSHAAATTLAIELTGQGISQQGYRLGGKILEVGELARRDRRVIEVHPEVSFCELAGRELAFSKRSWNGLMERRRLLGSARIKIPELLEAGTVPAADVLDAAVAGWSAQRYASGVRAPLPNGRRKRIGTIWR